MVSKAEQETTVSWGRTDDYVHIWTNNPVHVRKLEKDARAERTCPIWGEPKVREDELLKAYVENGFGVDYCIKVEDFNVLSFRAKRKMSDEQKAQAAERLRKARKSKND